jgi:hypothetical protein
VTQLGGRRRNHWDWLNEAAIFCFMNGAFGSVANHEWPDRHLTW